MALPATVLDRILALCAKGEAADVQQYLRHVLARGTSLAPVRDAINARFLPEFSALIASACPWLADDRFMPRDAGPAVDNRGARDVWALLEAAGSAGLPTKDFAPGVLLAVDVVTFEQPTGGRPRKMVRLRAHDPRFNPFAAIQ